MWTQLLKYHSSHGFFSINLFSSTNTSITRWNITWNQKVVAWWYQYVSSTWKASNIVGIQYKIHFNIRPWESPINYVRSQTFELLPSIATSLYPLINLLVNWCRINNFGTILNPSHVDKASWCALQCGVDKSRHIMFQMDCQYMTTTY